MSNKLSDILLMIQNTQIRIALEKMMGLAGVSSTSVSGSAITSDVTGDVTGNVTGDVTGRNTEETQLVDDDLDLSELDFSGTIITLTGDGTCDVSDWTPTIGVTYTLYCDDSTTDPTVTLTSGITVDGTNDIMTFADAGDTIILKCVSATRLVIVENIGAVALSAVV